MVEVVLDEGTPDEMSYTCFEKPEWVESLWAGIELPEWVTLDTVGGALVAIRESSFFSVTIYQRVAADLDYVKPKRRQRVPKKA